MPEIASFSQKVHDAMREFYLSHPVYSMEQVGELELVEAPQVKVTEVVCLKCGDYLPLPSGHFHASWFKAYRLTHEYRIRNRAEHCGGDIKVSIEPILELIPL